MILLHIDQFEKRKTTEIKRNHNYLVRRLASDLKTSIQTFQQIVVIYNKFTKFNYIYKYFERKDFNTSKKKFCDNASNFYFSKF